LARPRVDIAQASRDNSVARGRPKSARNQHPPLQPETGSPRLRRSGSRSA